MKRIFLLTVISLLAFSCTSPDVRTARELSRRIMGDKAAAVVFEQSGDTCDVFELFSEGGKVHIKGNNAGSMATGLNYYLQHYCLTNVSWYDYNPVELPEVLPQVAEKVRVEAAVPVRFFLNYCTFGYSMPWWGWKQWERFIDWMALNGVNEPLAITGQEAVWQKVWRKMGLSDEQIRAFFTGPAHLPWHRMCNIDRWQGPLPQDWIDAQAALQKKILRRERAFSMRPVLPAFAGHIPEELAEVMPGIDTFRVSRWGNFADAYRCTFLSPDDAAFAKIQKAFLEEQTRMYGTDHIYGADPFNEVDAPIWDPVSLARIGSGIYRSMAEVDPQAEWLQMGWLFYYDAKHWTPENIEAYLTSVPKGRMTILDYYCDLDQVWKRTNKFYGQNYIWCFLGNFGGMTSIEGDWKDTSREIALALAEGGEGMVGIGSTLEGFGVNEPIYEFVLSKAWNTGISDYDYIDNVADRHFGRPDANFRRAWHILCENVSKSHSINGSSSLLTAHPNLEGWWHWTTLFNHPYQDDSLALAADFMQKAQGSSNYYDYDLVNVRRQLLSNRAPAVRERYAQALRRRDRDSVFAIANEFLGLFDEMDQLLSTRREFSLDDWIADARSWGDTPEEKAYYERNARTILTVWGDSYQISDYANREWAGLMKDFYKPRWEMFFQAGEDALCTGSELENVTAPVLVEMLQDPSKVQGFARMADRLIWKFQNEWAGIIDDDPSAKWENLAPVPQMGWNAWNIFRDKIDEEQIKGIADVLVESGLAEAGYRYVNLDDGWHGQRDSTGRIHEDLEKFPSGMKALADYIHAKGLKFGLYSDAGTKTCAGYPGSKGYEYQDAAMYAYWGADYLKYDWCNTPGQDTRESYALMRDALRAAGRPILLSICEWGSTQPWRWAGRMGQSWRSTGDIGPVFGHVPYEYDENGIRLWTPLGVMDIIDRNAPLREFAGPNHWNDADMLEVGNGMSFIEDRAHFSMWCLMASPLMLGCDLRSMSEETQSIILNKDVIAIDQDKLGVQGLRLRKEGDVEYWLKPLEGGDWAFCLLNGGDVPVAFELDWGTVAVNDTFSGRVLDPAARRYQAYNLWDKNLAPVPVSGRMPVSLAAHDVLLYRLKTNN